MASRVLKKRYSELNALYFAGLLPEMPVEFADISEIGLFSCEVVRNRMPARAEMIPGTGRILICRRFMNRPRIRDGILLHEMIHAYFAVIGAAHEAHSEVFEQKRQQIEAVSGFTIPKTEYT